MQQQDAQFFIPVYQRNYDWRHEQCKQLLKDILDAGKSDTLKSHFIGSIVYIQISDLTSSPELTIIDGQQRLTTLTLFIAALTKRAEEYGMTDLAKRLRNRFLINDDMDENEKLKLKPIRKDDNALKYILGLYHSEIKEFSRVIENYQFFYNSLNQENIEIANNGFQKLIFIEIGLTKNVDDPQKIFQSLNSTGLDLSQADLIRNYILMGLNNRIQLKIYEKYWIEIEKNTTEQISKNNRMSDFIRDFLTFKFNNIPNQNKVFDVFKDRYQFENEEKLIELLDEIKSYSKFYNYFINPEWVENEKIRESLRQIKKLQINVSYPFLLQLFKALDDQIIQENDLIEALEVIQSFVWRRFICGVATNALNKIFMDLYKSLDENDLINSLWKNLITKTGSQRFPNNDEVFKEIEFKDMYNIQPKNKTYFLERLENYGHRIQNNIENNENVSIEHIFPQKPNNEWKSSLESEYDEMKKYVNTAANLTLSAFNSELSNSSFIFKRDLPEKGYKFSPLRIDKFLGEIDHWNLESLKERRIWIENRFLQIWKYPENFIQSEEEFEFNEINILDIDPESVRHKSIDYFIFFDIKYDNPSYQSLFKVVASIMFEREPDMFFGTELRERLKLTQDKDILRYALQISQTYFVESSLSAPHIIQRVQRILNICLTDDDLIIKLKN